MSSFSYAKFWLQVAKMMEPRLQDGHFVLYLGTFRGTAHGDLHALYSAVEDPDWELASLFREEDSCSLAPGVNGSKNYSCPEGPSVQNLAQKVEAANSELQSNLQDVLTLLQDVGNQTDARYASNSWLSIHLWLLMQVDW